MPGEQRHNYTKGDIVVKFVNGRPCTYLMRGDHPYEITRLTLHRGSMLVDQKWRHNEARRAALQPFVEHEVLAATPVAQVIAGLIGDFV